MKNISPQTIKLLSSLGYDVKAVAETGSKGHEDNEIVALAQAEKRVIITHDVGFGSIYYFSKRGQVGIIIIRIHPPTIEDVNPVLVGFLSKVNLDEKRLTKSLIVLNRKKYRVLK
ncbi:MAG: DUF5615 family PIN-like protein [Candidatus Bathyarchaeia archaeon]|jgi:predicted nuclease of predicted toxin-antitoxin system